MVERRMKEPEDTLTTHVIKRVFVVLLILRILLEVGTQPAWRSAEATTMVDNAQNALSVVESAGNGVAKVAKAEDAQNERSVVEPEPASVEMRHQVRQRSAKVRVRI